MIMQAKPQGQKSLVMHTIPGLSPALSHLGGLCSSATVVTQGCWHPDGSSKASSWDLCNVAEGNQFLLRFAAGLSPTERCHSPSRGGSGTEELSQVVLPLSFVVKEGMMPKPL